MANPFELRSIVESYVEKHYNELLDQQITFDPKTADDRVQETNAIIRAIKTARFNTMRETGDITAWIAELIREYGESFSLFVSQGQEFLSFHLSQMYADGYQEEVKGIYNSIAAAMSSSMTPSTTVELRAPINDKIKWADEVKSTPWLMFIFVLRLTYIDMSGSQDQPPPFVQGQDNGSR